MSTRVRAVTGNKLPRRAFLALAGTSIVAGRTASAQQGVSSQPPARMKGPLVWLDMDQQELDDAYNQAAYAPNLQQVFGRYRTMSEATRMRLGMPKRFVYGPSRFEGLDVFVTERRNAPIHVHIHGGAWRGGLASEYAFPAELFVRAGAHYVVLDFIDVVEAGGSLMPMASQVRRAIEWVYRNARSFDGDPNRVYVSGHSSGAHLAAVALTTNWPKEFNLPHDVVKGGLCCSGMFDLKPVRLSARSQYVKFTDEMEDAFSPQRHLSRINCPVAVAYGSLETPEFQRQARDFADALKITGKSWRLFVGEGYNHFEILETLANPYGLLGRAVLQQMQLG